MNNTQLFKISLENPEPLIDDFYIKNNDLLIAKDPSNPTALMQKNLELLESISAYSFAIKSKSRTFANTAIEKIAEIICYKNINYSEFVSFWSVVDVSYSLFRKLPKSEQLKILKKIVDKYIKLRHDIYSKYGYTPTTIQVGKDAKAHKASGNLGIYKASKILDQYGFVNSNHQTIDEFISSNDKKYIEADKKGKKLFKKLLKHYKIRFKWSSDHDGKMPDFFIKFKNGIYIVEHKHMKEGGGGQDKQMNEVISFVKYKESNSCIHYVSFLDGVYFNLLVNPKHLKNNKIATQVKNIKQYLKLNKQNYFLNTAGFEKFLKELN